MTPPPAVTELQALRRGLCPVCRTGRIFAGRWRMHERCPVCGTPFERSPGYFVGSMYITYAFTALVLPALVGLLHVTLLRSRSLEVAMAAALGIQLLLVPTLFRGSRVLWIHLGHRLRW